MKSYSNFVLQGYMSFFTKFMNTIHNRHVVSVCPSVHNLYCPFYWTVLYDTWVRGGAVGWGTATNRKVAGSIPDGVIGIFHWCNPSGRTMVLGLTQPLTEMNTRNISWGLKLAGAWGWQLYHFHVPIVLKSGSLDLLEKFRACPGLW